MAKRSTWSLLVISLLAATALSQDLDLLDAFGDTPTKAPPAKPKPAPGGRGGGGGKDLDLSDFFDFDAKPTTKPPRRISPKAPVQPKPKPKPAADDFDLSDALDPKNDIPGGKGKGSKGNGFSDSDLHDLVDNDGYKPDKGKGSRGGGGGGGGGGNIPADNSDYDTTAETGTIAGIASAVVMALVGAVSSYISYQKKKLCFGLQQNMNTEYQKAENPEAVVFQEAPIQETRLQPPNAEPSRY